MFELKEASWQIDGKTLLHPIDLTIDSGKVIGLIGHNGSGKSTLLKILARQQTPSSGYVSLKRKPLASWRDRAFAQQIAYLPQQLPSTEGLTTTDLVRLGRYPWHGALGRFTREDQVQVERAMELTGTGKFADRNVNELSGGERQKVWIAMLIAQNARYLLLDEPTSALDIAHQVEVLALIRKLGKELAMGVVVVLHDINMAATYCDHLVALHGGHLLTQGSPQEIMRPEVLKAIYGIYMSVIPHPHAAGSSIAVA